MMGLTARLEAAVASGVSVYPRLPDCFAALNHTPLNRVRVVILGQDPYHGAGQATGLSFSVPAGVKPPPSLRNILTEVRADMGTTQITGGDLLPWARQGVLLLNTVLTVEADKAGSHVSLGWEALTGAVVEAVLEHCCDGVVFLLWGKHAAEAVAVHVEGIGRHHLLTAPHPSPLSAWRGFFGCRHFSKANRLLEAGGHAPIRW